MSKASLYAIGASTPLESNKSLHAYAKTWRPNSRRSVAANE
jgi:hypothetical protein